MLLGHPLPDLWPLPMMHHMVHHMCHCGGVCRPCNQLQVQLAANVTPAELEAWLAEGMKAMEQLDVMDDEADTVSTRTAGQLPPAGQRRRGPPPAIVAGKGAAAAAKKPAKKPARWVVVVVVMVYVYMWEGSSGQVVVVPACTRGTLAPAVLCAC